MGLKNLCTVHVKSLSDLLCVAFQTSHPHRISKQQQQLISPQFEQQLVLQQQQKVLRMHCEEQKTLLRNNLVFTRLCSFCKA